MGLSQYELGNKVGMQHSMIGSYERVEFYPTLDSIHKLGTILDINILCNEGYSNLLLHYDDFKYKLIKWRKENNLTKRDAANIFGVSERGYSGWENGCIINVTTYYKIEKILIKYNLIYIH